MTNNVLVDNDVIIKMAAYDLAIEALMATTMSDVPPAMLAVGRFVVRDRLRRSQKLTNRARAEASFEVLLARMAVVEPTEAEIVLAAGLETTATSLSLELDGGESQLLAVLIVRQCRLFVTGDKRAVKAIATIAGDEAEGRIASIEQLITEILRRMNVLDLRARICSEANADRALSICFSCHEQVAPDLKNTMLGICSYINHLRKQAPGALLPSDDLSALAS